MKDDVVIVIPAYNPSNILVEIINKLQEEKYTKIIVINDGSKDKQVFDKLKNKVIVLEHAVNQGKGCALKIGFSYCSNNLKDIIGVITVDADGQHEIDDINKLYSMFQKKTNCIILGSRNFKNRNIPLKSKFGNNVMSKRAMPAPTISPLPCALNNNLSPHFTNMPGCGCTRACCITVQSPQRWGATPLPRRRRSPPGS